MFSILATRMLTTISRREFVVPITSFYKYKKEIFAQNESVLSTVFYHRASSIEKYEDLKSKVMSSQNPKIKFPNKRRSSKNSRKKIAISQNTELLQKAIVVYNCTSKSVENLPTYSSNMLTLNSCGDPTIPHLQSNALTCTLKSSIVDFTKSTKIHELPDKQPADEPKEKLRMLSSKLRNEIPMFFEKKGPWHDFNIYTKQIGLYISGHKNPEKLSLFLSGLKSYKLFVWLYRQINLRYLSQPTLDLLSMDLDEGKSRIEIRWRVTGWTPASMLCNLMLSLPANRRYYDYVSTIYVNDDGKIWRHDVCKVRQARDSILQRSVNAIKTRSVAAATAMSSKIQTFPFLSDKISTSKKPVT